MKSGRHRQWISIGFILVLTLAGMCFDKKEADSCLPYPETQESHQILNISRHVFLTQDLCTEDLFGIRARVSTIFQKSRARVKTNSKMKSMLSILENLSENPLYIAEAATERVVCKSTFSSAVIIGYIHRQDGKKNN